MPISRLRSALVGPLALAAVLMVCSNRPAAPQYPPAPDRTSEPVTKPSDRGGAPELVAPRSLSAHFSAGTARVFALDWNGHRIEIKEERGAEEKLIDAELRAVAVVGLLDHGSIRVNYAKALGIGLDRAHPQYLRVELERQNRTPEGDWSPWRPIDPRANRLVIENITEQEEDLAPPETRLDPLVDMIPFLRKGHWKGIHLLDLNPKDDRVDRLHVRDDRAPGRTEAPVLLVRQFDFTAEPGRTYRYRARVVADPSAPRDDRPRELAGPWSEPTRAVTVPPEDAKPEEQPKRVQP